MSKAAEANTIIDCRDAAEAAGLTYAATDAPGITRHRAGEGFSYRGVSGERVSDAETLKRIRALVIPPAWTSVWICGDPNGHIQAIGYDDKGRRQYRYHPKFREVRDGAKFEHMMAFAEALPRLRRQVALDMAAPGLGRRKVLATIVHLLETTMIRVGNLSYARENKSYGLTTLQVRHVKVERSELKFHFKGKSGKIWKLNLRDRRVARIVKSCQELPGQHLFQYIDDDGARQAVTSADVNDYLKTVSGSDITAKDFRTWTGTVLAAMALAEFESVDTKARAKKNVTQEIERVSARLGNTPTICRKCYVHPEVVNAYLDGGLLLEVRQTIDDQLRDELETLRPEEAAVLAFLRTRVTRDIDASRTAGSQASAPTGNARRARVARPVSTTPNAGSDKRTSVSEWAGH
jgi:DNA topoisomerase-1